MSVRASVRAPQAGWPVPTATVHFTDCTLKIGSITNGFRHFELFKMFHHYFAAPRIARSSEFTEKVLLCRLSGQVNSVFQTPDKDSLSDDFNNRVNKI